MSLLQCNKVKEKDNITFHNDNFQMYNKKCDKVCHVFMLLNLFKYYINVSWNLVCLCTESNIKIPT